MLPGKKTNFFNWGWIDINGLFSSVPAAEQGLEAVYQNGQLLTFLQPSLLSKLATPSSLPVSPFSSQTRGDAKTELARLPEPICPVALWSQSSKKPCSWW